MYDNFWMTRYCSGVSASPMAFGHPNQPALGGVAAADQLPRRQDFMDAADGGGNAGPRGLHLP